MSKSKKYFSYGSYKIELPKNLSEEKRIVVRLKKIIKKCSLNIPITENLIKGLLAVFNHKYTKLKCSDDTYLFALAYFSAINYVSLYAKPVLNEETINALNTILLADIKRLDLKAFVQLLNELHKHQLFNSTNIKALTDTIVRASKSFENVQTGTASLTENLLKAVGSCPHLSQDLFEHLLASPLDTLTFNTWGELKKGGRLTDANFNAELIVTHYNEKMKELKANLTQLVAGYPAKSALINQHANSLLKCLNTLFESKKTKQAPRPLLSMMSQLNTVIKKLTAHPEDNQASIRELMDLSNKAQGHPSPAWKKVGMAMMVLGAAIALAAGIVLSVASLGLGSPVGLGLAALSGSSLAAGAGFFAYGQRRSSLSKEIHKVANIPFEPVVAEEIATPNQDIQDVGVESKGVEGP